MKKIRLFLVLLLVFTTMFIAGCTHPSVTPASTTNPATTYTTTKVLTTVVTTATTIAATFSQTNQNVLVVQDGVIEYRNPEKILKSEDLHVGDLIQMSLNDSLYEKNHAFIIRNISYQNNRYLIQEIAKGQINSPPVHFQVIDNGKWFGILPQSERSITFGGLIRDYPYKIGHASKSSPQIRYVIVK